MNSLDLFLGTCNLETTSDQHIKYLRQISKDFGGLPSLTQIWMLMDQAWEYYRCDPSNIDEKFSQFYQDPIWLLNGLFVELNHESYDFRALLANYISSIAPSKVGDYGGGFGTLSRLLATSLPTSSIELIEPFPHPLAAELINTKFPNLSIISSPTSDYDLITAIDVLEHVHDPINLAIQLVELVNYEGYFITANCFHSVIKCHLEANNYLSVGWNHIMRSLGLTHVCDIGYANIFKKTSCSLDIDNAYKAAQRSKYLYRLLKYLPRGKTRVGDFVFKILT